MEKICFLVIISALILSQAFSQTCKALVLTNGGDKGAYQAGVVQGLVSALKAKGDSANYDVIAGVGVGSLNAAFLAQYAKGDETNMASALVSIWNGIKNKESIYNSWFFGLIEGLTTKNGLYDPTALKNLLTKQIKCTWKRKVTATLTNADLGESKAIDLDQISACPTAIEWLMASSALAIYFPYQQIDGYSYIDGAVLQNMDIDSAVRRCKEIVSDESKITIDVVMATNFTLKTVDTSEYKPLEMLWRYLEIYDYVSLDDDIIFARRDFPLVNFRYLISPSKSIEGGRTPLDFNHTKIAEMIELGEQDAAKAVEAGITFDDIYEVVKNRMRKLRNPDHPEFAHPI